MVLATKCSISATCLRFTRMGMIGLPWLGLLLFPLVIFSAEADSTDPQKTKRGQQVDHWLECPRIATYQTFKELTEALPRHFKDGGDAELLVIGLSVYGNPCLPKPRVGGSGEESRVAGSGEHPRIGGSGEQARVAGSGEQAHIAGSGEQPRIGGSGEQARVAGSGEQARVAGSAEQPRIGGSGEQARVARSGEQAQVAGSGEQPRVGGSAEQARVAGSGETPRVSSVLLIVRCAVVRSALGYIIDNPLGTPVYVFDGAKLWQLSGDQLIPLKGEPVNEQKH